MSETKPSSSAKMRALEHRYQHSGGVEQRYRALYREGRTYSEIACEFGINPHTLRTYWVRKWNNERNGT